MTNAEAGRFGATVQVERRDSITVPDLMIDANSRDVGTKTAQALVVVGGTLVDGATVLLAAPQSGLVKLSRGAA